jgi:hypothetical protein
LVVAAAVTPLVRWAARRGGIVDNPGGRRVNTRVIPRLGGLAVVAGFFAPLAALAFTQSDVAEMFYADPLHMVGLLVGGIIVVSLGAWDDIRGVRLDAQGRVAGDFRLQRSDGSTIVLEFVTEKPARPSGDGSTIVLEFVTEQRARPSGDCSSIVHPND